MKHLFYKSSEHVSPVTVFIQSDNQPQDFKILIRKVYVNLQSTENPHHWSLKN